MNDPIRDSKYAAEYLNCAERTLRAIRQRGEIAFVRCGYKRGKIGYLQSDLDAFIQKHRKEPRRPRRGRKRS